MPRWVCWTNGCRPTTSTPACSGPATTSPSGRGRDSAPRCGWRRERGEPDLTEEIAPQPLRPYDSSVSEEVELSDRTVVVDATTTPRRRPASHARPESPTDLTDLRWLIGAWVIVLVFAAITAVWSEHVGIPLRDPQGKMFRGRLTSAAMLFALFAVVDAGVRSLRTTRSLRGTFGVLRARWPGRRLLIAANGLLVYHLVYVCYRNLK